MQAMMKPGTAACSATSVWMPAPNQAECPSVWSVGANYCKIQINRPNLLGPCFFSEAH